MSGSAPAMGGAAGPDRSAARSAAPGRAGSDGPAAAFEQAEPGAGSDGQEAALKQVAGRFLREELRGRSAYGAPQIDVPVRLNTNENSYPLPPEVADAVIKAVSAEVTGLNRYPDRDALVLRSELAAYLGHGIRPEQVWAANGSNEIQQQLLQAFAGPGRVMLGFGPAYSMHPLLALGTATRWVDGGRGEDFGLTEEHVVAQVRLHRPHVTFLCSPNNPTGTALDLTVAEAVLRETDGLVVVDEAYAEFRRPGTPSALSLLDRYPNLVVTRTMSKAFAFAGVRLGYLAADRSIVDAVQLVRLPYHLSALTQAAARAALAHAGTLLETVDEIKRQRDRIVAELRSEGLTVADSDANFVLFGRFDDQKLVWQRLLDRGVLVRDVGLPGWLRVTAGTPEETDAFMAAMKLAVEEAGAGPAAAGAGAARDSAGMGQAAGGAAREAAVGVAAQEAGAGGGGGGRGLTRELGQR